MSQLQHYFSRLFDCELQSSTIHRQHKEKHKQMFARWRLQRHSEPILALPSQPGQLFSERKDNELRSSFSSKRAVPGPRLHHSYSTASIEYAIHRFGNGHCGIQQIYPIVKTLHTDRGRENRIDKMIEVIPELSRAKRPIDRTGSIATVRTSLPCRKNQNPRRMFVPKRFIYCYHLLLIARTLFLFCFLVLFLCLTYCY
jgi:hypothetical protein